MKTVFQLIEEHGLKGLKIRRSFWEEDEYIEYDAGSWIDEVDSDFIMDSADDLVWELYEG